MRLRSTNIGALACSGCSLRKAGREVIPVGECVTSAEHNRRRHLAEIAHKARVSSNAPRRASSLRRQWLLRQSHLLRRRGLADLVRFVQAVLLTVSTSLPRRSVCWLSGHLALACFPLSCSTSGMKEWVKSCAAGAGERTVRFAKPGYGILEDERCIDTGVFQNRYFMHEFVFDCSDLPAAAATNQLHHPDTNRLVCPENCRHVRSGSAACCRDYESVCARDLMGLRVSQKQPGEPFASRQPVSPAATVSPGGGMPRKRGAGRIVLGRKERTVSTARSRTSVRWI